MGVYLTDFAPLTELPSAASECTSFCSHKCMLYPKYKCLVGEIHELLYVPIGAKHE